MKAHTNNFKEQIKLIGKEIDSKITFGDTVLGKNELNAVTPSFQSSILKSTMKQLDIDSNVYIPVGSVLRYEFGLKVNGEYEYINFGNYIVKDIEKQEDTNSYKITCYDKMLLSMKDYAKMPITYPITIRDYINSLCTFLGLRFANANSTFVNYNKTIPAELYLDSEDNSLGYTFRDVFDELAQVTASTICINDNDEVEIRYINNTGDTIDEEYLKDVNVNFGEKYGKVNSIVLSRSGQSDNIYLRDETSVEENGLCELKIIDNQIMNFNDRDEFLPEILGKLNGLEYYLNDFTSTGITYYDICDRYNVKVGDVTYSCVMFNDEILVTQGLQENVFTEMPEETETDYTKADKTDRKINQTYIIVDKQNQQIESVVSQTDAQNEKIAKVTQTVEELNSKISDIAEITISADSNEAKIELDNINQSEPIRIVIRPIGESISYLYPNNNIWPTNEYQPATQGLTPSSTLTPSNLLVPKTSRDAQDVLYLKTRTLRFYNKTTEENFDMILPDDLLYYNSEIYDEFILDYDGLSCVINKKLDYNADGSIYVLNNPITIEYEYPHLELTDGDYEISILGYNTAYLFVRLMAQNIYTTQFATKAEVNSEISQTAQNITLSVDKKLESYSTTNEMNSQIQLTANDITSTVSQTYETKQNAESQYSQIKQTTDNITSTVSKKIGSNEVVSSINQSAEQITLNSNRLVVNSDNFKLSKEGNVDCSNANITGGNIVVTGGNDVNKIKVETTGNSGTYMAIANRILSGYIDGVQRVRLTPQSGSLTFNNYDEMGASYTHNGMFADYNGKRRINIWSDGHIIIKNNNDDETFRVNSDTGNVKCVSLTQTSLEESKKNFEKFVGALNIINDIDLYKYNLKIEDDKSKKHIGFVIGNDYKYSSEITTTDENGKEIGVDLYSMTSLCLQAIKEQQEIINQLKEEINLLKESEK